MKFGEEKCWIWEEWYAVWNGNGFCDKLYCLDCFNTTQDHAAVASQLQSGSIDLWHQCLRHLNGIQLKEMATRDMVEGMKVAKSEDLSFCEECVEGKMPRQPYQEKYKVTACT